ncbi:MAG: Gfo/Idh/MocA family oxidoreductase [Terracoccus sp.]
MGRPLNIGIVGVGTISAAYLATLPILPGLRLKAVSDLDRKRADGVAAAHGLSSLTVDQFIADPSIDAVLNLTVPAAHAEIGMRALQAGKHIYGEKPLALTLDEARPLLELARERGLRVGSAPDTVLGTGLQTAVALLKEGRIGSPIGAAAHLVGPGHERWHPAPHFYYQPGGGPLFDMGPYYLSALVWLLGPIVAVSGAATRSDRRRVVAAGPQQGQHVPVDVDTHVSAILQHQSGVHSTLTASFETWASRMPLLELYGAAGTISVPDPNRFSDPAEIWTEKSPEWTSSPILAGYANASRGYGLADMARAIETRRPHRASGVLAFHVLETMDAIVRASHDQRVIRISSTVDRLVPVPIGSTPDSW